MLDDQDDFIRPLGYRAVKNRWACLLAITVLEYIGPDDDAGVAATMGGMKPEV